MTSAAALPGAGAGAVLRVVRGAAGRRWVWVALLVGGLFVLGVLCGERASAADKGLLPGEVKGTAVTGLVTSPVTPVVDTVTEVTGTVADVVPPVGEHLVEPVTEQVVMPVGDLVESVTEGLAEVPSQLPPVTEPPSLPGLPDLPELPEWSTLPVETLPVGALPVDATPQEPGAGEAERPGPTVDDGGERAAGPAAVVYGPRGGAGGGVAVAVAVPQRAADAGASHVMPMPGQRSPHGDGLPTGALGGHAGADNNGPRHGEPHAVTSLHRAPLRLVPGATAVDAAGGTRDRHRDVPEFPG
ncbi:hypothetical protein [Streptomyces adelaidensis]|uniref:hypothetical protein n=1 Tax=Streptomyces adelaidensis TaxID=2796465 RepID=UPI001907F326|nr:hypothetical protein [Streptomyces adelaidensis]